MVVSLISRKRETLVAGRQEERCSERGKTLMGSPSRKWFANSMQGIDPLRFVNGDKCFVFLASLYGGIRARIYVGICALRPSRQKREDTRMIYRLSTKLILSALVILFGSAVSRADSLYTVTENFSPALATSFSFIVLGSSIPSSGDVTAITQISGSTVTEFSWASSAICNLGGFGGDGNACITYSSSSTLFTGFAPGSFLADGTYTSISGDMTVTISPSAPMPEPSSLLLLGTGLLGLVGAMRRRRLA